VEIGNDRSLRPVFRRGGWDERADDHQVQLNERADGPRDGPDDRGDVREKGSGRGMQPHPRVGMRGAGQNGSPVGWNERVDGHPAQWSERLAGPRDVPDDKGDVREKGSGREMKRCPRVGMRWAGQSGSPTGSIEMAGGHPAPFEKGAYRLAVRSLPDAGIWNGGLSWAYSGPSPVRGNRA
jgi:hypothetical protein